MRNPSRGAFGALSTRFFLTARISVCKTPCAYFRFRILGASQVLPPSVLCKLERSIVAEICAGNVF